MAQTEVGRGHNKGPRLLTDEEHDDLVLYYSRLIRTQQTKADAKKAEYDVEKDGVNALFSKVKGDLRYKRKEFEQLLDAQRMKPAEFKADQARRLRLFQAGGLPVGQQLDLFRNQPQPVDTVTEQEAARADGRRAYLAYEDPKPPEYISPILHQAWMEGWQEEQSNTAMRMARAEATLARLNEPDPEDDPVDLNEEGEGEGESQADDAGADGAGEDEGAGGEALGGEEGSGETEAVTEASSIPDAAEVEAQARALEESGFTRGARRTRGAKKFAA
jgi:hypothetical protein